MTEKTILHSIVFKTPTGRPSATVTIESAFWAQQLLRSRSLHTRTLGSSGFDLFIQERWVKVLLHSNLWGGRFFFFLLHSPNKLENGFRLFANMLKKKKSKTTFQVNIHISENNIHILRLWDSLYRYIIHFIHYFAFIDFFIVCLNKLYWGKEVKTQMA